MVGRPMYRAIAHSRRTRPDDTADRLAPGLTSAPSLAAPKTTRAVKADKCVKMSSLS